MRLGLAALLLTACGPNSPYPYCDGTYKRVPADEITPLGFSPQQAIDLHGLSHTGELTWQMTEDVAYPVELPADS